MAENDTSFEEILDKLGQVVRELEQGGLPIEEALKRFEQGVELSRKGAKRLEEVERRIEEVLEDGTTRVLKLDLGATED